MAEAAALELSDILFPAPDHPGWQEWRIPGEQRFNQAVLGLCLVRREDDGSVRLRMFPEKLHTNPRGDIHGGAILSLVDAALFAGAGMVIGSLAGGVTLDVSNQFVGRGQPGRPLDAITELVRETGSLLFTRGVVMQGEETIATYSGIVRKIAAYDGRK